MGFSGKKYNELSLLSAQECLNSLKSGIPIPQFHKQRSTYLPPVVAILSKIYKRKIKILDFGGGYGIGYMSLEESIGKNIDNIEYIIIEVPEVVMAGKKLFKQKIIYKTSIPLYKNIEIIHASSSLQYIKDWKNLIKDFTSLEPEYILLSDVFAGNIKTFCTLQNYYESKIPHWFINIDELLSVFNNYEYELIMKSYVKSQRLNTHDILPMENFPNELKIEQTLHLLFKKNGK